MRKMVQRRLLDAKAAAAAVIVSLLVLSTSNGGSLSAYMAPEVFFAKEIELHYGSEMLHARDSCGDPGTVHAVQSSTSNLSFMVTSCTTAKSFWKGPKDDGGSATVDENAYFRSDDHRKTYEMVVDIPYRTPGLCFVFPNKTYPLVHVVFVDAILGISEGYEDSYIEELDTFESSVETKYCWSAQGFAGFIEPADNDSKPLIQWIFLKPLTKELWLATVCFVFYTGFVLWMIERSITPAFEGSSLAQFSTALYFVFSTLTFSHGQILRSPLSKIVLVVWCFAVLVVVQSYLATLSSMLAAEASTYNSSSTSAAGPVPLTLSSFSGLFVVTGWIFAFMLLINFTRLAYAAYTRARGSESQSAVVDGGSVRPEEFSTPQNDAANSLGAHVGSAISRDEEAGVVIRQDGMAGASEPAPDDVSVQIEMTSTSNCAGGSL